MLARGRAVWVEPFENNTFTHGTLTLFKDPLSQDYHVQSGRIIDLGPGVREQIKIGDVVCFLGWKGQILDLEYAGLRGEAHVRGSILVLDEDDLEIVLSKGPSNGNR